MNIMEAIQARHSVRAYTMQMIEDEKRQKLAELLEEVNNESGLNISIFYDDPKGFDSRMAHYGKFQNVENYIVLKGRDSETFEEDCGYYGEKLVLAAQMMGLNTCWVGLTFNKRAVKRIVPEDERFCMVIALGYGQNQGMAHKSKSLSEIVGTGGNMPDWFREGAEAALLAPTAMNQQKFKIGMIQGEPAIKIDGRGFYTRVDLGIVKYHFEAASGRRVRK